MSPLRQQMQADMVLRGFTKTTQAAYLSAVIAIAKHFHRSPDQPSPEEIQQSLLHLIADKHLSCFTIVM